MNTIQESGIASELGLSRSESKTERKGELGQEDFLMLMTAQLKNQDPFKPLESGEFMSQLAEFGAVSGIQELQTAFRDLSASLQSDQSLQAAGMVGREVLVASDRVNLANDETVSGAVELAAPAGNVTVRVENLSGQLIRSIELGSKPSGMAVFEWDGLTKEGEAVPPDSYRIRAEVTRGGSSEAAEVFVAAQVNSVTLPKAGETLTLELAGLGSRDFSSIRQIR